jgi:hypothetical protein
LVLGDEYRAVDVLTGCVLCEQVGIGRAGGVHDVEPVQGPAGPDQFVAQARDLNRRALRGPGHELSLGGRF